MGSTCIESFAGVEVNFGGNCSKGGEMLGVFELLLLQLAIKAGLLARWSKAFTPNSSIVTCLANSCGGVST